MLSAAPKDMDRGGGGYDDQGNSSREDDSAAVFHVADGGGACGVNGEKAGVIGDSWGYDLHVALRSPGLDELGLASEDIQFGIPWEYSKVRVVEALDGTGSFLALPPSCRLLGPTRGVEMDNLLLGSGGEKLSGPCGFIAGGAMFWMDGIVSWG